MKYNNIQEGIFLERPNRFIAYVQIEGVRTICHVKNTGRCKELLIPGVTVYLEQSNNPNRKTMYDLIAVRKGEMLINMDSQAPNAAVKEWLSEGGLISEPEVLISEYTHGESRFDFYVEKADRKIFIEVKGVTLEANGVALFPDAPTARGVKHIKHLTKLCKEGSKAYLIFVVQFQPVKEMRPNDDMHAEFGEALRQAKEAGVNILCLDCLVTPGSMIIDKLIPVVLKKVDKKMELY